jgi:hypothetical protein
VIYEHEEDTDVTEVSEGGDAGAVDTSDVGSDSDMSDSDSGEAVEAADATEPEDMEPPEAIDWNGELEGLKSSEWFSTLDEDVRDGLLKGLENKYQNWQRGYTSKFQDISKQRKEVSDQLQRVRAEEAKVQRWLHGDVDPMVEKQREIDELQVAHKAAMDMLRKEFADAQEKLEGSHGTALEEAVKAREAAEERITAFEEAAAAKEKEKIEEEVDLLEQKLVKEAPEIYENKKAFGRYIALRTGGDTHEEALEALLPLYRKQAAAPAPEPVPEPVPEGMKLMNMGPDSSAAVETDKMRSYTEIMEQRRKEAMREQELLMNS